MNPDPHVHVLEPDAFLHDFDDLNHREPHSHHVFSLLNRVSLYDVRKPEHNIAIADRVDLVDFMPETGLVELGEELPKHGNDLLRLNAAREFREACDVCEEKRHVLKLVSQLVFAENIDAFELLKGLRKKIISEPNSKKTWEGRS